eukprot:1254217-Amphidinium_carterae.1
MRLRRTQFEAGNGSQARQQDLYRHQKNLKLPMWAVATWSDTAQEWYRTRMDDAGQDHEDCLRATPRQRAQMGSQCVLAERNPAPASAHCHMDAEL